jgi:hypothetical protein
MALKRQEKPRIVVTDGDGLHVVRNLKPAHQRYYRTYGVVVGEVDDGRLAILVYGEIHMRYFKGWALQRVPFCGPTDWRAEWTPERLKKRIRQYRKKMSSEQVF